MPESGDCRLWHVMSAVSYAGVTSAATDGILTLPRGIVYIPVGTSSTAVRYLRGEVHESWVLIHFADGKP
jgi:hypothetical protein